MTKTLLIGTTGMLKAAAAHAAARSKKAYLVSRHADDFSFDNDVLDVKLARLNESYENVARFLDAVAVHAPYDLVLSWIRPPADLLRAALDGMIAPDGRLIEVMGSRSILMGKDGEASIAERRAQALSLQPSLRYAQVILGFVIGEDGSTRWLTHDEISSAAITQMDNPVPRLIAGTLEPWDKRPQS
ncbi:MAG: hypothetical protein GC184_05365 [Rhizobiales bacterium]|nr:hypothetical protein [Hyphomicrobiales bacterium]